MTKILEKLKLTAARMVRAAEGIRQQIQQQGQEIDDRRLMKMFILPHFETAFQELQDVVLDECDADEAELEEAVTYYIKQGNTDLKELSNKIRLIYREFGGEVEADAGDGLEPPAPTREISLDVVIRILQMLDEKMSANIEAYIEAFKEKYGLPNSQDLVDAFQQGMMALSEE
jgi:hypothetical protein